MSPRPSPKPAERTAAEIAGERNAAARRLADREAELRKGVAEYEGSLDQGRAEALAARERVAIAEVDRDIARRAVAKLGAELEAAEAAERIAAVGQAVAAADEAAAAYEAAVRELLPEMGRAARGLMRLWAEAELAHERAVEAVRREHGAEAIEGRQSVEAFRTWPGRPHTVVETETRELWTNKNGVAVADDLQSRIREQADGRGRLNIDQTVSHFEFRRTFRTERFLPAQDAIRIEPLVSALSVPGVTGADNPGWRPLSSPCPRSVLAQLDSLEQPSAYERDTRKEITEDVPVGLAVRVAREPDARRPAMADTEQA